MSDVFISYAREDQEIASRLAAYLSQRNVDIWWDSNITAGDRYRQKISEELAKANKVVVIWSVNSVQSVWVQDEAEEAAKHNKLVPVIIGDCVPPMGFRSYQALVIQDWTTDIEALYAWLQSRSPQDPGPTAPHMGALNQAQSLDLLTKGRAAWNGWAQANPNVPVNFSGLRFTAPASFEGFVFPGPADFSGTLFQPACNFSNAEFRGDANFRNCSHQHKAIFIGTRFQMAATFADNEFSGDALFMNARYEGPADFRLTKFSGAAGFEGGQFSGPTHFDEAHFKTTAWFRDASFREDAEFQGTRFEQNAEFKGASFHGNAWFNNVVFEGEAWFPEAEFGETAWFGGATFRGDVWFRHTRFNRRTSFTGAKFLGSTSFNALSSEGSFSLSDSRFEHVPDFSEARFGTSPRLENMVIHQPAFWFRSDVGDAAKYHDLRRLAVDSHDNARERDYFAQEVRTRRFWHDKPWQARFWFGAFYEVLSKFGTSLFRPFFWWALSTFACAAFYYGERLREPPRHCPGTGAPPFQEASVLSLKYALAGIAAGPSERFNQIYACLYGLTGGTPLVPASVSIAHMVQTIWSLVLALLFIAALRNLFRIK